MASCGVCFLNYNAIENRPVVGSCGHTFCYSCSFEFGGKCPNCRQLSFLDPATNYELLELLGNISSKREDFAPTETTYSAPTSDFYIPPSPDFYSSISTDYQPPSSTDFDISSSPDLHPSALPEELIQPSVNLIEPPFRCPNCLRTLHYPLPLRKDGVSTKCTKWTCGTPCIVAKASEGKKWMRMECVSGRHYQEQPFTRRSGERGKCAVCKKLGNFLDASVWIIREC